MKIVRSLNKFLVIALVLAVGTGCSSKPEKSASGLDEDFKALFPSVDMNDRLQLKVNDTKSSFEIGSEIPLRLTNKSNDVIHFALGSFIKLLLKKDDKWIEIKNDWKYSGLLQLSPQNTPLLDSNIVSVKPMFDENAPTLENDELLRIVIIGEIIENDNPTGRFVGVYVDVLVTSQGS